MVLKIEFVGPEEELPGGKPKISPHPFSTFEVICRSLMENGRTMKIRRVNGKPLGLARHKPPHAYGEKH
ncbi:MAG: hypothetical protein ACKO2G_03890, partial [Verrucomicrobiales bacterium]